MFGKTLLIQFMNDQRVAIIKMPEFIGSYAVKGREFILL